VKDTELLGAQLPLSVYVHVPWCEKKCPYCDFNSHARRLPIPERAYVDALLADLDQELPGVLGRRLVSVFIGGGTPSLLSPRAVDSIVSGIRARIPSAPDVEITLEANPGSSDARKFEAFRAAGVNRLSIGAQSFDDASLARIGRIHDARAARQAASAAVDAGFDNFNLDLMYGLPGQSEGQALRDLEQALQFDPPHLSCYQLTVEPDTVFASRPPTLPDEDTIWEMQLQAERRLGHAGYDNYEVSAFARQDRHCRHNLNYWQFGDYLGIGAGAHGKLTRDGHIVRRWKLKSPIGYMRAARSPRRIAGERRLGGDETGLEFMMNALRLRRPFTASLFCERTGLSLARFDSQLRQARLAGLLRYDGFRISTTDLGRRYLDDLLQRFLPERPPDCPAPESMPD
jgi:oxygen-independent coproporphyrinogen-3 oxidase